MLARNCPVRACWQLSVHSIALPTRLPCQSLHVLKPLLSRPYTLLPDTSPTPDTRKLLYRVASSDTPQTLSEEGTRDASFGESGVGATMRRSKRLAYCWQMTLQHKWLRQMLATNACDRLLAAVIALATDACDMRAYTDTHKHT